MDNAPAKVPWQDLRYLFGDIMYGGHIVNDMDRLVCNTYLQYFLRDELLDELPMFPYLDDHIESHSNGGNSSSGDNLKVFTAPKLSSGFERMLEHIDICLVTDTSLAFGLHPNTEILFSTESSEKLIQGALTIGGSAITHLHNPGETTTGESLQSIAEGVLQDILETYREIRFDIGEIMGGIDELQNPFQNILLQECDRMNNLLEYMTKTLQELDLGFRGDLTMSDSMEVMQESLYIDKVPTCWQKHAYPSQRSLSSWLADLQRRISQLQEWSSTPSEIPLAIWLPGLFNPQSFLTAIMQTTSKKNGIELDKLAIITDITKRTLDSLDAPSRDGQYIYGLSLEGAHWDLGSGVIDTSLPKEMSCSMPVINCRAVIALKREQGNTYECPVYRTQRRGSTYVFTAQLRTNAPPFKWILAGAALVMEIV